MTNSTAYSMPGTMITPELIINTVADVYQVKPETIYQRDKHQDICEARMLSMFLIRKMTRITLVSTGLLFKKDHATVSHGCRQIVEYATINKSVRSKFIETCHRLGLSGDIINSYLLGK